MRTSALRIGYIVVVALLALTYYRFPGAHLWIWAAIGLCGVAGTLAGVRLHRPAKAAPWLLLAAGLLVFTAGDTVYNALVLLGHSNPFPGPGDVLYLLFYLLTAAGFLILIRVRSGAGNRAALLDALVPTVAVALLAWVYWIAPYTQDDTLTLIQKLVSVAYPIGDVLVVAMTLRLLTAPGRRPPVVRLFIVAMLGLLVSDVFYGQAQLDSQWAIGGPIDLGWIVFYGAMGFAALDPSMRRLTEPAPATAEPADPAGEVVAGFQQRVERPGLGRQQVVQYAFAQAVG